MSIETELGTTPRGTTASVKDRLDTISSTSGGVPHGTAFPVSPRNEQPFFRTDEQRFYIYDSATAQWISTSEGDHGALGGLLDDDHPQYLRTDGTREATGNIDTQVNLRFKSNTDFQATLDHANTAARTYTYPDVDLTVAGRSNVETLENKKIEAQDGTVSLPVYTFEADPDSGRYRPGADQMDDVLGGTVVHELRKSTTPVNHVRTTSADTATGPSLEAVGADTNISLRLLSKGTSGVLANGYLVGGLQIFTASGNFTVPPGVTELLITLVGGGGGGGGGYGNHDSITGSGGGSGGEAGRVVRARLAVTPGAVHTVTIGAGGTAGTAGQGNVGGDDGGTGGTGGTTSFSGLPFGAPGGLGGVGGGNNTGGTARSGVFWLGAEGSGAGAGTAAGGGSTVFASGGAVGGNAGVAGGSGGGAGGSNAAGGKGGNGGQGGTGSNGPPGTGQSGFAGAVPGGGGGGGGGAGRHDGGSGGASGGAGGAGGAGLCIVEW